MYISSSNKKKKQKKNFKKMIPQKSFRAKLCVDFYTKFRFSFRLLRFLSLFVYFFFVFLVFRFFSRVNAPIYQFSFQDGRYLFIINLFPSSNFPDFRPTPNRFSTASFSLFFVYLSVAFVFWYPLKMISWPLIKKEKQTMRRRRGVVYLYVTKPLLVFL